MVIHFTFLNRKRVVGKRLQLVKSRVRVTLEPHLRVGLVAIHMVALLSDGHGVFATGVPLGTSAI